MAYFCLLAAFIEETIVNQSGLQFSA